MPPQDVEWERVRRRIRSLPHATNTISSCTSINRLSIHDDYSRMLPTHCRATEQEPTYLDVPADAGQNPDRDLCVTAVRESLELC